MGGKTNLKTCVLVAALSLAIVSTAAAGRPATYYVNLGESIQARIDDPNVEEGDTIIVAPGVYDVNEPITYRGKNITLKSTKGPEKTIIRMQDPLDRWYASVVVFESGEGPQSVLEGFMLTGGGGIDCIDDSCGGGIYVQESSPTIKGNLVVGNTAYWGGGIACCYNANPLIINCTVTNNEVRLAPGGIFVYAGSQPTIKNSIIWGNRDWAGRESNGALCSWAFYCLIGGEEGCEENGNISGNPRFADAPNDDYHLLSGSPCIDAGDPNYVAGPNETDLDGKPRIIGGQIDMGAYEFQGPRNFYVDDDAPNDPGPIDPEVSDPLEDGTQAHPFDAIQEAIDEARCGDMVIVLDGTYTGQGNRDIDFDGKAITVRSENGPENCIIDCQDTGRGFCFHHSEDANCVLSAFTITNGNSGNGGAVYCSHYSCPTLTDCIIVGNTATSGGGTYGGSPTFIDCIFSNNSAGFSGGAIYNFYNPTLINCTLSGNSARSGGGMYSSNGSPTLINCTFIGNSAMGTYYYNGGGGMFNNDMGIVTLIDCTFIGNYAFSLGGGMFNWECTSPTLTNCVFSGNSAYYGDGGGICNRDNSSPTLTNCTFSGNLAGFDGGGMDSEGSSNPTLANCILWSNIDSGGIDESAQIHNRENFGTLAVNYSCIQGLTGELGGIGNIGDDTLFADADGDDNIAGTEDDNLRLLPDSPCIDAGDPNHPYDPNETDLDGKPRVMGGRIDMGAYESPIFAEARILPRTINLASKGKWITAFLWLPEGYNVADIDANSVLFEDEIGAETIEVYEGRQIALVRFSREQAQAILEAGDIELTITGQLTDGTIFEAKDVIIVINKGSRKSAK